MKNSRFFCLIFLFTVFTSTVCAQKGSFTFFSEHGEKFWVIINGVRQNATPETNVRVENLTDARYRMKIIFEDDRIKSIDKNIWATHGDVMYDQSILITKDRKGNYITKVTSMKEAEFVTSTPVNQHSTSQQTQHKPVSHTQTSQNQNELVNMNIGETGFGVNVKDPETGETFEMNMNVSETGVGVNVPGAAINMNVNVNENMSSTTTTTTTTHTTVTTGHQSRPPRDRQREPQREQAAPPAYILPGYNGPVGCPYPMSSGDFNSAKASIASKSFEDSKLTIAKQVTSSNCLLASQVKEIMTLFSFEDTKLSYAKYAYPYTFDIGNYYKLNDAFKFEMTIDELNEFVSKQRR